MPYADRNKHKDKINKYAREYIAEWRKKNRERYLNYARKYKRNNNDRLYQSLKSNPERYQKFIEYTKKYCHEHKDRLNGIAREETKRLSKNYLVGQLCKDGFTREFIYKTPTLVEIKKYIIKIKRLAA